MIRLKTLNRLFSSPKDPEILIIRHAESTFNKACHSEAKQLGIDRLPWHEQMENEEFVDRVCFNQRYVDCSITEKGIQESRRIAGEIEKQMPVDLVLVSPHLRALQTCFYAFQGKSVPIIVEPILAQSCRFSCDIVQKDSLEHKKKLFPHFNFNSVQENTYTYSLTSQKTSAYLEILSSVPASQHMPTLMTLLKTQKIHESNSQLRQRAWQVKQKLKSYSQTYGKICIISHWYLLTYILSRNFSPCGQNIDYEDVGNCQLYKWSLNDLLKIK